MVAPSADAEPAAIFATLGDPTRLRLLKLLFKHRTSGGVCVNSLAGLLGVTPSAVSQHLRTLKAIGLVSGERRGNYVHYSIDPTGMERYRSLMSILLGDVTAASSLAPKYSADSPEEAVCLNDYEESTKMSERAGYQGSSHGVDRCCWPLRHQHLSGHWCHSHAFATLPAGSVCCCHHWHGGRRFLSREEMIAQLEEYLRELRAEVKGVEERLEELKSTGA